MLKKITERIFPFFIALSALSVSASAAFYSISGLSKLFAGAAFAVIVMAASLEVAKLVIASLLYQYRKTLPIFLKVYLSIACIVLILITSMGIYGFLSSAYQDTANREGNTEARVVLIETKRDNVKEQLEIYTEEKTSINTAITDLRNGLANNTIQYRDRETGQIITTTSSSTRRALEKQLDQAILRQTEINGKVDSLNTKIFEYETKIVETRIEDGSTSELGPLKYLSGLTGTPMDKIINYLLLTIIFVFDPLAIALVVAANFAFDQIRPRTKENLYGETVKIKEKETPFVKITEEDLEADLKYGHEDEERMDVIGQNGNDGLHYEEEERLEIKPKEKETYAEGGYMQSETSNPPPISFTQEAAEINKIMGKDLTLEQMERLKNSKLTRTFNSDDDDLKIHY